jgi:hypothetical protein
MSRAHDLLARDISLWLSGETIGDPADRAVAALATDPAARRAVCAAIAVEDLVRDWYGGIPLPPLEPAVIERERRRSLVSAGISALAASLAMALVAASGARPFDRAVEAAEALTMAGAPLPLATSSVWHLRQQMQRP